MQSSLCFISADNKVARFRHSTYTQNRIDTYVFIGPLLPGITDRKEIIAETCQLTDSYVIELFNIEGSIWFSEKEWNTKYMITPFYQNVMQEGKLL